MSGAALIPAIFTCVERLLASDRQHAGRWCAATAGALGLQAVAGHPQVPIYTALAAGLFTVVRAVERHTGGDGWRQTVRSAVRIAGAYALGYLLAAVQLLPWIELARLSTRAAGTTYAFVFRTSTAGAEWLLFLFPYMLGAQGESIFASGPLAISEAARDLGTLGIRRHPAARAGARGRGTLHQPDDTPFQHGEPADGRRGRPRAATPVVLTAVPGAAARDRAS